MFALTGPREANTIDPTLSFTLVDGSYCYVSLDLFKHVCAPEFALLFEAPFWERLLINLAYSDVWAAHAAIATSVLTRLDYFPAISHRRSLAKELECALFHYTAAIRHLNIRLNESPGMAELAVIGSIMFINIEHLQRVGNPNRARPIGLPVQCFASWHLQGGLAIVRNMRKTWVGELITLRDSEAALSYLRNFFL